MRHDITFRKLKQLRERDVRFLAFLRGFKVSRDKWKINNSFCYVFVRVVIERVEIIDAESL